MFLLMLIAYIFRYSELPSTRCTCVCVHLSLQIRSYNAYVSSNWSSPLLVSVDNHCQYAASSSSSITYSITTSINSNKNSWLSLLLCYVYNNPSILVVSIISSTRSSVVRSVWSSQSPITISSMPANSTSHSSAIDKPLIGATAAGMSFLIISIIIITGIMTLHWILRRRKRRLEFVEVTYLIYLFNDY